MSIDRFIIKKLDDCHKEITRVNLARLFRLRIIKAEREEESKQKGS